MSRYPKLDQGLLDQRLSPVRLPINLQPGSSELLFLRLGILVDPTAYEDLKRIAASRQQLMLRDVTHGLARNHRDFYGNEVDPVLIDDRVVGFRVRTVPQKEQQFVVCFRTARGLEVTEFSSYYSFDGVQ